MTYQAIPKTASTSVRQEGVYLGNVTRVDRDVRQVWVEIPRLVRGFQQGPLSVVGAAFPVVGDRVACGFLEGGSAKLVVLGVVSTPTSFDFLPPVRGLSTARPVDVYPGTILFETDTGLSYQWVDGEWLPFGSGSLGLPVLARTATYGEDPELQAYEVTANDVGALLMVAADVSEAPTSPLVEITVANGVGLLGSRVEFTNDFFVAGSLTFGVNEAGDTLFVPPVGKLATPREAGSLVVATKVYENVEIASVFVDVWLLSGDLADDV